MQVETDEDDEVRGCSSDLLMAAKDNALASKALAIGSSEAAIPLETACSQAEASKVAGSLLSKAETGPDCWLFNGRDGAAVVNLKDGAKCG